MRARFDRRARQDAFTGSDAASFEQWRRQSRETLTKLLGLDRMERCAHEAVIDETVELADGIRREHLILQVEPGIHMTAYLLIPREVDPERRVMLALPGHMGAGKYSVAGCKEIPAVADAIARFNYDYGWRMARKGYVTVCPDCRGFGERRDEALQSDEEAAFMGCTCFHLSHMAEGLGETVCGMNAWDEIRLIDYLEERGAAEGWHTGRYGCLGFSGGGMQTLWLAAMDERVDHVLISGYLYGYRDSLLVLNGNCSCNYVPGLWTHFDMGDIASLIAPGRLFIQSCRDDDLNGPRGLVNVEEQMVIIRNAYRLLDAEERVTHDIRPGGHCFHPELLETFA
ncbi:MAG: hypothetical protein IJT34_09790 [Butyrivibrio sp.]|nr:hypothetical protein [Butyrivibrio sp.]